MKREEDGKMRFHFLNVSEGDCHIMEHDSGRISVVDIHSVKQANNASQTKAGNILAILEDKGNYNQEKYPEDPIDYLDKILREGKTKSIFRFILTHPEMDHMRGIKDLFSYFRVENFWDTTNTRKLDKFQSKSDKEDWEYYQRIRKSRENPKALHLYRDQTSIGKCCWTQDGIKILSPTEELVKEANKKENWNMLSYVLLIEQDGLKIVLAGDSTDDSWEDTISHYKTNGELEILEDVDVLVAPHHGRKSNQNYEFLRIMRPKLSLIGNAQSEHLNYDAYNRYSERTLTNNQAGNVVIQKLNGSWYVLITNKAYAEDETDLGRLYECTIADRPYYYLWKLK